jgi:hypothetical protein
VYPALFPSTRSSTQKIIILRTQEGQGEQAFPGFDFWLLQCSTALLALFGSLWLFMALYGSLWLFMALYGSRQ